MDPITRRNFMAFAAGGTVALAAGKIYAHDGQVNAQPFKLPMGGTDPGPIDPIRLPNMRFSYADSHVRKGTGGWTRQITTRELAISTTIAGVNIRLNTGGIRELHWHKEAEWAYMVYGKARITAIDTEGGWFVDDVAEGDLWYFPSGIPHSIQGLGPDGCEFLLAFDDGNFDEDSTFLLSDWFKHVPSEVLAKNFDVPADTFSKLPSPEDEYIFAAGVPGSLAGDAIHGAKRSSTVFSHRMMAQQPITLKGGTVRITDSSLFKVSTTIAAAIVELKPGAMRELHWHPNNDELQYYLKGVGCMGVFASSGMARTFDFRAGDVGYVPLAMGHYVENTGEEPLVFLELFRSNYYADISLKQWLALTPPQLVKQHLELNDTFMKSLDKNKSLIVG